jgi:tetratricopeptide (TPR) repeat protein
MSAESSPTHPEAESIDMTPSYRVIKDLITIIPVLALFLLISVNPLAQSTKLPAPATYVSDFAGVIDAQTKSRLESLLQKLKEKSKVELYVATVESTGEQKIADFSQQLARDWNIALKTSRSKTLLLLISVSSKTSFTQFSRAAQLVLPEGVLGEMSYRMQGPLSDGRFTEALDDGVHVFVNALAEKFAFNAADLESAPVAMNSPEVVGVSGTVLISGGDSQKTRPRTVTDTPKATPESTPPAETATPTPAESPVAEVTPTEAPKTEPSPVEAPKLESIPEAPKKETPANRRKATATTRVTPVKKKPAPASAEEDADESEKVELVLTLPLDRREAYLKEFIDTHPNSKSKGRANELLLMTYAGLASQKIKSGDTAGGIEQLHRVIEATELTAGDELFSVIAQFPMNVYLSGERDAAFKLAQNIEAKFGSDPKRLLAVARFYMGIERAAEAVRIADTAVRLAPDLAEAHRLLAMGHHISLRLDDAVAEYKKALELDPNSKASRATLADLYRASGKSEEALALYNEQLLWDPKDRAARAGKVLALFELGRSDEANTALEATLVEEPRNLALLAGTAYWLAAHNQHEKAYELARKAVDIESRYTWGQIALARSLIGLKRPIEAERAMRTARKYGKFPTLTYELANVLASMGLYEEAADALRESFTIKEDRVHTYLAGHLPVNEPGFLELLAPERRAGFYQATSADTPASAMQMKALLAFQTAITVPEGEKINQATAVAAAKEFASGTDSMRVFRQTYAASRLIRYNVGLDTALELIAEAKKAADDGLKIPLLTMAVQADEYRELRARSIATGNVPDVGEAPPDVMANILQGRLEDLHGWALFNQEKYTDAITHLKQAAEIIPAETPAWRTALWHLGVALEQSGEKTQALDAYLKSYRGGPVETVRRSEIERLYKSINGSLDGLEDRIAGIAPATTSTTETTPVSSSSPEPNPSETPKSETVAAPAPAPASTAPTELSDEALQNAASRLRSNIKITGRIVDSDKVGLSNVVVVLISPSGAVMASTTDNDGYYSFKVAPSQKTYRVIPSKDGYAFTPIDRTFTGLIDDQKDINFIGTKP